MSENISSNVLFHFTSSMDNLKSILKNGFSPRYCPEYTLDPTDMKEASRGRPPMRAAPMVCFCDLPMSLIGKHLEEYGSFGIGLTKQWGIKNGVAPVIYTHLKAQTRGPILSLTADAARAEDGIAPDDSKLLAAYTKPFAGFAWRDKQAQPDVEFYDEREWRYVPAVQKGEPLFLGKESYMDAPKMNKLHKRLGKENPLSIPPDDIQYLIVPYDKEEIRILELHRYLMRLYSRKDAILVTTTIMTDDRIHEDI